MRRQLNQESQLGMTVNEVPPHAEVSDDERRRSSKRTNKEPQVVYPKELAQKYHFV